MARSLPLVLPAPMIRVQAGIALSAGALLSLQTDQSSARAGEGAKPHAEISRAKDVVGLDVAVYYTSIVRDRKAKGCFTQHM